MKKTLILFAAITALAVLGLSVYGFFFGVLGTLVYQGTNYMAEQHGSLLFGIVIVSTVSVIAMAACRTQAGARRINRMIWDIKPEDGFYDGCYKSRAAAELAVDKALSNEAKRGSAQ